MTFASINFQKHISPKVATKLLMQDWSSLEGCYMFGCDECGGVVRSSRLSGECYKINLPAC